MSKGLRGSHGHSPGLRAVQEDWQTTGVVETPLIPTSIRLRFNRRSTPIGPR